MFVFIVNPVSGNLLGIKAGKLIEEYCKSIGANYKIIYTENGYDQTSCSELKWIGVIMDWEGDNVIER